MGGLHFYCGKWLGEDKSANPILEVIDDLSDFLTPTEEQQWHTQFMQQWIAQQQNDEIALTQEMLDVLVLPVSRYRDALVERLNLSGPDAGIEEFGPFPRTFSLDENKFWCLRDILAGYEVARRENKAVMIHFC
jgi:hypothetical protein